MKVLTSSILFFLCVVSYAQYGYDNDYLLYDDVEEVNFGPTHDIYLETPIEITEFDRDEYEKIIKLMILKSRGLISVDMDNIDPNFDPEQYFESQPGYGDNGAGGGDSIVGTYEYDYWQQDYVPADGEYAEDWYEYEENLDQYEDYAEEDAKEQKEREKKPEPKKPEPKEQEQQGSGWNLLLIIVLAVLLVIVIVYLFFSKDPEVAPKKENLEDLAPTEIPKSELEIMLEKALAEEDYRRAIRIYFIFMMKDLSEKGWITWQKKKTNLLYLREMKGRPHFEQFKQVVSIYEVVWYGKREISRSDYDAVEPILKQTLIDLANYRR